MKRHTVTSTVVPGGVGAVSIVETRTVVLERRLDKIRFGQVEAVYAGRFKLVVASCPPWLVLVATMV